MLLTNHLGLHMPQAATSWASCLFVVSFWYIVCPWGYIVCPWGYIVCPWGTLSSIKKPAEAGS
ncbi:hypothetical protein DQF14_20945 [Shigella flexneri]|nr:hypothetical protein [Shigella flexneri]EGD7432261.1 hypothetical protein [Shigella flexneri]